MDETWREVKSASSYCPLSASIPGMRLNMLIDWKTCAVLSNGVVSLVRSG